MSRARSQLEQALVELRWRAYARDPEKFFEECLYIPSQQDERGRTRFKLYDHQREDLETFLNNRFVVVLKGRQIGLSTLVGAKALWRCLFRPGSVILWVSNNQENAVKAVNILKVMWTFLPEWVKGRAPELTSGKSGNPVWTFQDGLTSRIRAYAGTSTAGAGESASIVILDEFALVDAHIQDDLLRTADPTTDAGGSLWIISTARGGHNRFAQTFTKAQRGESRFVPIFHPWMVSSFINPRSERLKTCQVCGGAGLAYQYEADQARRQVLCPNCVDTTIYEAKAKEFDEKPWLVHAEYPATVEEAFRESGNPVFRDLPLEEDLETQWTRGFMRANEEGTPLFVEEDTGLLRVRDDILATGPISWHTYVLFLDPSEGIGGDYTAAHILGWDSDGLPEIVAWWHDNYTQPVNAAREMDLLGRWFNNALLAVENTGGWGGSSLTELNVHSRYPNLYVHVPTDARRRQRGTKLGFPMSWVKRPMVVDRLVEFMQADKQVGAIHPLLRQELGTFVQNENGRMEADVGQHDDLVMSLAGALWILVEETTATNPPSSERTSPDLRIKLKSTREKVERAFAAEQAALVRWERRMGRRALSRKRVVDRRQQRIRS